MADTDETALTYLTPQQQAIIKALQTGNTRRASAAYAGVSHQTFYRWLEENVTFCDAVTRAEATAEVGHVGVLAKAAIEGDWKASLEWLRRRRPNDWGDQTAIRADKRVTDLIAALFPEEAQGGGGAIGDRAAEAGSEPEQPAGDVRRFEDQDESEDPGTIQS